MLLVLLAAFGSLAVAVRMLPGTFARRRVRSIRVTQVLSVLLLRVLNVRVHFDNPQARDFACGEGPYLILPNHISYLDAVLVCAYMPAVFVTSREIERTPFLGVLTRSAGCAFVERRHKGDVLKDVDQLATLLNHGLSVTVFPEGSTSPGDGLMEFKKTLLESAIRSRCRVLPVAIKYLAVDRKRYDESNRDSVAWYGDMTFFPHLVRLAATQSIDVRITVMDAVPFRDHGSRKRLAHDVRTKIAERFHADV